MSNRYSIDREKKNSIPEERLKIARSFQIPFALYCFWAQQTFWYMNTKRMHNIMSPCKIHSLNIHQPLTYKLIECNNIGAFKSLNRLGIYLATYINININFRAGFQAMVYFQFRIERKKHTYTKTKYLWVAEKKTIDLTEYLN